MAPRSRTGCLTCRQRKLKCSEERPVCTQCIKANRECIPSSGITFRHQQNPSMNGLEEGDDSLKSFYGYKETFGKGVQWVPIPSTLKFVHTNNPYHDEAGEDMGEASTLSHSIFDDDQGGDHPALNQAAYPAYATHGLEALSAVASQDQYSYAPPPATMAYHEPSASEHSQSAMSPQHSHPAASQNLDFILNPKSDSADSDTNIDPRLHSQTPGELGAAGSELHR